jgi:excisionase family DNA binding protein
MTENPSPTTASGPAAPLLVNAREAARLMSISTRKLWSMTAGGEIAAVRCGRAVRYDPIDLRAYIEKHKGGRSS